jgi:hypothetical protein
MGNFPIQTTSRSLPSQGPNVYWNVDTRTGEQFVAQAMGQLGQGATGVGLVMNRLQADTELADAIMADRQAIQELAISLEGNTDPHTYDEAFNKTLGTIQGREIKNGLAAREHSLFVKRMTPRWQAGLVGAKKARIESNFMASLFQAETAAIQGGSLAGYELLLQDGVDAGIIGKDDAEKWLYKTQYAAEKRSAEMFAMNDPEGLLAIQKGGKIEGFDMLTAGDAYRIRNIAINQQHFNDNAQTSAKSKQLEQIWDSARTTQWTPEQASRMIDNMPNLTATEKANQLRNYLSIAQMVKGGKGNPYVVRQDAKAYAEMIYKLDTKPEDVTLDEIWEGVGTKWTVNDYLQMRKMLPSSEHYDSKFQNDPIIKRYFQDLRDLYPEGEKLTPEQRKEYHEKSYELRAALKAHEGDVAKMENEYKRITNVVKEEKAKGWLEGYWKLYSWSPGGILWGGLRKRTMRPTITDISQVRADFLHREPKTIEEFNIAVMALDEDEAKEYFDKHRGKFGI